MTEDTLEKYFNKEVSSLELKLDLKNSISKEGKTIQIKITKYSRSGEFTIVKERLLQLINDTIDGKLSTEDISTIAFCLEASEFFTWDNTTDEGKRVAEVIANWSSPVIYSPLTDEYLTYCGYYLETGNIDRK